MAYVREAGSSLLEVLDVIPQLLRMGANPTASAEHPLLGACRTAN
jgi:hypothetical protein